MAEEISAVEKTAVVTGASRGIGKAVALALAKEGYALGLCCRENIQKLNEVKEKALAAGSPRVLACRADLSDYEEGSAFAGDVLDAFGQADVLVNNAGISIVGLFQDLSPQEWRRITDTNIGSVYTMCHALLPSMIHRKAGRIINISSVWGNVGGSCEVAYSATKGAVNALTKALGKELAPSGIAVNAIACGAVDTEMNAVFGEEALRELAEEIPAGRMCRPEEVAQAVLALIQAPAYLTGQVITLDGGWI
ncbi:MAG: SDR family NAD(P)-dependent oxidoreductase [Lachnospiraceae bacterium]|jgi:3-oxoacyl-[acyl-carrier protein] reductase|nr:SDR family NAD(P)-dependent oxidoreductase [Lachnospiraceae bacterium]MCH4070895.1 SDR family NAD(P)-dependent oxidoreductase [Lachnospiraceae bacterium]MCH4107884.1 SDR family NAD(P)-dependent oxidoreductase [Lachnospiraceae bacterium]MCI1332292.1 SDR family NAD(P)-dependent oxidoreductase [Lachnospiraceae bacterium]MCI1361590.1 SDR family NAD(P)-dependent oxidoreductase [Lachnospiraceae bacterium]